MPASILQQALCVAIMAAAHHHGAAACAVPTVATTTVRVAPHALVKPNGPVPKYRVRVRRHGFFVMATVRF